MSCRIVKKKLFSCDIITSSMSDVCVLYECLLYMCIYIEKQKNKISLYVCLTKEFFSFQMFGFPTDLFGLPNNNNSRRMNSNALIPHQPSLFGNSMMIGSPFAGINSLISNFGINTSPFAMMHDINQNSVAPMQSFTSTTVMSYNGTDGRPKVYQETTARNRGPGGIEETRQAIRDTERGINKVSQRRILIAAFQSFVNGFLMIIKNYLGTNWSSNW